MEAKPTLMKLRRKLNLDAQRVADVAGLPLRIEYLMEIGAPVEREHAVQIMAALSRLAKQTFTVDDVEYVEKEGSDRRESTSSSGSTLFGSLFKYPMRG
jgi:hypothetical protein